MPAFLRNSCRELHQQETLAEIAGDTALGGVPATRIAVALPPGAKRGGRTRALHRIFDRFAGGASEYDDARGEIVAASAPRSAVAPLSAFLRASGYAFTASEDAILTDACRA